MYSPHIDTPMWYTSYLIEQGVCKRCGQWHAHNRHHECDPTVPIKLALANVQSHWDANGRRTTTSLNRKHIEDAIHRAIKTTPVRRAHLSFAGIKLPSEGWDLSHLLYEFYGTSAQDRRTILHKIKRDLTQEDYDKIVPIYWVPRW